MEEQPYNKGAMNTYNTICQLVNEEIDEVLESRILEDEITFENEEQKESYRDDLIADYLNFLKKDLQSDNA